MIGSIGATLYSSVSATSSRSRPWQVASAVALGVASGLVMTSSPLGAAMLCLMFFLPVHLPLAIFTALLTAGFTWTIEPALGQLGLWAGEFEPVTASIASLNSIAYVPWLRLNNSVVLGGIVLAAAQCIPTYVIVRKVYLTLVEEIAEKSDAHWIRAESKAKAASLAAEPLSPRDAGDRRVYEEFERFEENYTLVDDGLELDQVMQNETGYEQKKSSKYEQHEIPPLRIKDSLTKATLVDELSEPETEPETPALLPVVSELAPSDDASIASSATSTAEVERANETSIEESALSDNGTEDSEETDPFQDDSELPTSREALSQSSSSQSDEVTSHTTAESAIQRVEESLESRKEVGDLDTKDVAARAAELAGLVDEMLTAIKSEEVQSVARSNFRNEPTVGIARVDSATDIPASDVATEPSGDLQQNVAGASTLRSSADPAHSPQGPHLGQTPSMQNAAVAVKRDAASLVEEVAQHEEALRYLLHHLKEIKDQV